MPRGAALAGRSQPEDLVTLYLRAKDENRPHLMPRAFAPHASLEMVVKTDLISFPTTANGVDAITDVLVRKFDQTYENVYTFCLRNPHRHESAGRLSCDWLVGMSLKDSGELRIGCGRYDWRFQKEAPFLVEGLKITIETMQLLAANQLQNVMDWLSALPYPWCPSDLAAERAPGIEALQPLLRYIERAEGQVSTQ